MGRALENLIRMMVTVDCLRNNKNDTSIVSVYLNETGYYWFKHVLLITENDRGSDRAQKLYLDKSKYSFSALSDPLSLRIAVCETLFTDSNS